jgi:cytoskeleton protein RodZ
MSLGSDLRAAREAAGLSLVDVAERTRIRRTLIEHIEADDFDLCGGDVYARGHVRTLARVVGLDPEPLVAEFDRLHQPTEPTASEVFESETHITRERKGANWTAVMVAALIVIAGIGGFQLLRNRSTPSGSPGAIASQSGGVSGTTNSPTTSPTPTASATGPTVVAQATGQGVQVQLTVASGKSWVAAANAQGSLYEGLVSAGQVKTFSDPQRVKLVIGNAGAVRLIVNGVDLGSPGGSGQVVRLSFGPGNPTAAG